MKFLLVGNRGVQHALAARLLLEGQVVHVYPGQPFGAYPCVDRAEALQSRYDVVVLGSPRYVTDPVVIEQVGRGAKLFGPDPRAVALESSKSEFKRFCAAHGIPTATSQTFTDYDEALQHVRESPAPYVIKADGPARGCGVSILGSLEEAEQDVERKLKDKVNLYYAGKVLVEQYVEGFEVAVNVLIGSEGYVVLPPTRPHKRRDNDDTGPIVAGMGSFAPVSLNADFYRDFHERVLAPAIKGMREEGMAFRGCLFINLMVNQDGVTVLEFNCRMGDPAMLTSLALIRSSVAEMLLATVNDRLSDLTIELESGVALAVTLVDQGYPDHFDAERHVSLPREDWLTSSARPGLAIAGIHMDAKQRDGVFSLNNGVVACAVARGADFHEAGSAAYALAARHSQFHFRTDIGAHVLPPANYVAPADERQQCVFQAAR